LLRVLLLLTPIWWMYADYAWLTNDTGTQRQMRLLLIAAMAGFLVMALSIPDVFGGTGLAFGLAYLLVVVLHLSGFYLKGARSSARAILGLAPYNLGAAVLVIAAAFVETEWRWLLGALVELGMMAGLAIVLLAIEQRLEPDLADKLPINYR
jgi:low temperature requirement protein LtrA